jgi:hypothetical protein
MMVQSVPQFRRLPRNKRGAGLLSSHAGEGEGKQAALKSEGRRPKSEGNPNAEIRNPKAEIAKLSGIGSALNTEAAGTSVSRNDCTE